MEHEEQDMTNTNWTAPNDTAFLRVDIQNDFCPGGLLAVPDGDRIIPLVNNLAPRFRVVIDTQDFHPAGHASFAQTHNAAPYSSIQMPYGEQRLWPTHCVQGTQGAEFHAGLIRRPSDLLIRKGTNKDIDSYSGVFENDHKTRPTFEDGRTLPETLRAVGIKRVVLTGLAFDFCVGWNALDLKSEGFDVVVVKDATRAISLDVNDEQGSFILNTEKAMTDDLIKNGVTITHAAGLPQALGLRPAPAARPAL